MDMYLFLKNYFLLKYQSITVADPGFPIGGHGPIRGGMDLRRGCFLAKMYAKMKEFGPIGGHVPSMPPRSTNV